MDSHISDNSDSNFGISSHLSRTNTRKNKDSNDSEESDSTILNNKIPQKSHEELRVERIAELNMENQKYLSESEYEKAITTMKKLIFFEPSSN